MIGFKILRGHTKTNSCVLNSCVAVLSDEKIIGSSKFEIKICNVESKTCLRSFNVGFTNYIESFIQLSNVVSCSSEKTIKVWDIETSVCLNTLEYHDGGVYSETLEVFKHLEFGYGRTFSYLIRYYYSLLLFRSN
jgi:WD40 repeat protein